MSIKNLFESTEEKYFWIWVDPNNFLVKHHVTLIGCFFSAGLERGQSNLMYIPNPEYKGDISPFQMGTVRNYTVEYNLEINREAYFSEYPSRLNAIFLLPSHKEAMKYAERHPEHVSTRVLKKVKTVGKYKYSYHDSSWINFMRLSHAMNNETIYNVTQSYWSGLTLDKFELKSMGINWSQSPIIEILFLGTIDFYNRDLNIHDN
jgi:hypothetical protein